MVRVWSVQAPKAYQVALGVGAFRASPKHLENDFVNDNSYGFMSEELQKRVGPCPEDVITFWKDQGGTGLPAPVWVWLQAHDEEHPEKIPDSFGYGLRSVVIEAELSKDHLLASQFNAFHHVLNNHHIALTDEEDDELRNLKETQPDLFEERKIQSWQHIFEVDWQGDEYTLERRGSASIQAVLWQLPLTAITKARRVVGIGYSKNVLQAKEVSYTESGPTIGEDVQLTAVWIKRKQYVPPVHLRITVTSVSPSGATHTSGVEEGWRVTCILNPIDAEDPLPVLPRESHKLRPVPAADAVLASLCKLNSVQVVYEPPEEEPDSCEEFYENEGDADSCASSSSE